MKVNEIITNKIMEMLESGNLNWLKTWSLGFPRNYITQKEYKGINVFLLNMDLNHRKYKYNEWLTFKQVQSLSAKLRKGAKSSVVTYFTIREFCSCGKRGCQRFVTERDLEESDHRERAYRVLKYYRVFNIADTNLKSKVKRATHKPIETAERVIYKYWSKDKLRIGNPAYNPLLDMISMPEINSFDKPENYYSAYTHELVHSTGAKERLNRVGVTDSTNREVYAFEELIAELGSAFLCAHIGIDKDITNTSAYIQSWLRRLQNDKNFIFKAVSKAQESYNFILAVNGKKNEVKNNEKSNL